MFNEEQNPDKKEIQNVKPQKSSKGNNAPGKISDNRLTALCGVFMALAMILSYLESLIPINAAVPGVKLGLANLVTIIALRKLGLKPTIIISVGRIILSGILFGNVTVIIYSLAGAALSIFLMYLISHIKIFTLTGVSICGAVAHNLGQLIVAALVLENANIMYYMIVLALVGTVAGTAIGILAGIILKNISI